MTDKLSKEELLAKLNFWSRRPHKDHPNPKLSWNHKDEQAYQQIKEMIQKREVTEEWIEEKGMRIAAKYGISEVRARKIIRSLVGEMK